ncbi:hypothetical protein [Merismopedia glauca]|uniref:Uncharacterized protein n=1 Tax=Merismopedia glauca CCAP 1448/3 TaxID=1296344 RepID=A0A2T1BY35_9CYAN|nr:hypothetical protein [Merismopedia glauca]PSB00837.1 hypothetical protein C7B64_21430 [Merismopedia glauca CCAP 1448/3]
MSISLEKRIQVLEQKIEWMSQILAAHRIDGPWLSPAKAAPILGVSRQHLIAEIQQAQLQKNSDLKCGIHYRHKGKAGAIRPSWQINVVEFAKVLAIPPQYRKT